MAVWERQATSVELCTIQMSTEPPERDAHMDTEIKTQRHVCMWGATDFLCRKLPAVCVCVRVCEPAAVGAERESPAAEPGSWLAADCPEGCTQQGFHQGLEKAYLRGAKGGVWHMCTAYVARVFVIHPLSVRYVPVCGLTKMLPGGIPFSMM